MMFDCESFLARLAQDGITVTADGDTLKLRGTGKPLSPADRMLLVANKPAVLAYLGPRYRVFRVSGPGFDANLVLTGEAEPATADEIQDWCSRKFGRPDLVVEPVRGEHHG